MEKLELGICSFEKNVPFFHSFRFFWKEGSILAVLFRSFEKNVPFLPFFSVLLKKRSVLAIIFRSFEKNVPFLPFFSVLLKRTEKNGTLFFPWAAKSSKKRMEKRSVLFEEPEKNETLRLEKNGRPTLGRSAGWNLNSAIPWTQFHL